MKLNPPTLTAEAFVKRWQDVDDWSERATYQEHFRSVCQLVGAPTPSEYGQHDNYTFEYGLKKISGEQGYADVFNREHFAIEYKKKGRDLKAAYEQLLRYREALENPPLLIVCDIEHWEIHTNWPNTAKRVYSFTNSEIVKPEVQRRLHDLFFEPMRLHPAYDTEHVTKEAAAKFEKIVEKMVAWKTEPDRVARYLTKLVFCLFAEDVELLPLAESGRGIFSEIAATTRSDPARFQRNVAQLFTAMNDGGEFSMKPIHYFNGTLFKNVETEMLDIDALGYLFDASKLDWSSVEPSIFGTLFERSLDPGKRAQLGAHYTSKEDILLIVEPVLMQPLRREWAALQAEAEPIRREFETAATGRIRSNRASDLLALREKMLHRLRSITVLDPACGSGNFLYMSLRLLKDMEKEVINHPLWAAHGDFGLQQAFPEVHPRQLYGIEREPIAHALASIVVWIGYIQWHLENGYLQFGEPILQDLSGNIVNHDAILTYDAEGKPTEPEWPVVDVIVSNPPFLGGKKQRTQLDGEYLDDLFVLYEGRVPHEADLVTYWFERARAYVEQGKVQRVGLLATNSIRGGTNREVLNRIKRSGDIFMAWADREWINEGAAVRVSMIGFDNGAEKTKLLDEKSDQLNPDKSNVDTINADLTSSVDITKAKHLPENFNIAFMGDTKGGSFDISDKTAREMLGASNSSGVNNADVVRRWVNGLDITRSNRMMWIIDFGVDMPLEKARLYEEPFNYVREKVLPLRQENRRQAYQDRWWIHVEARPSMREKIAKSSRYIATPTVAKHRLFVWLDPSVIPDHQLIAVAREDDYFFGVLHSYLHELWSLRMGTSLEDRPRYTPTSTFETFPFPFVPGKEDFSDGRVQAISAAAKALNEERAVWLNPPNGAADLKDRTLTNLYNALQAERGQATTKGIKPAAAAFAPRLNELHRALDSAVVAAYGWDESVLSDDEAILRALLALNQAKAGGGQAV